MVRTAVRKLWVAWALGTSVLVTSCSTDIDLLEDYKPITVVYGLLNGNDTIQYIKINKAFLGEGNALLMAEHSDSINYMPDELTVQLQKIHSTTGEVLQNITCDTTTQILKDDGIFYNPYQIIYKTTESIDQNSRYKLIVTRNADGGMLTAVTPIVDSVTVTNPSSPNSTISLFNATLQSYRTYSLKWNHSADAQIYSVKLRFTYYDSLIVAPYTVEAVALEMNLGEVIAGSTATGGTKELKIEGENFFNFIDAITGPAANTLRFPDESLEIILSAGAEDLRTYIEVNKPSLGLIQEKPVFSNVTDGTGIFSSRWSKVFRNRMDQQTIDKVNEVID